MKLINLTSHPITILRDHRPPVVLSAEEPTLRCEEFRLDVGIWRDIILSNSYFAAPPDLPEPQPGVIYIVSLPVAICCTDRRDLVVPDEAVRDSDGHVIGCKRLSRVCHSKQDLTLPVFTANS